VATVNEDEVGARELLAVAAGAVLLAIVMHWPLILHLGSAVPRDLGDPLPQAWQVAWGGHALTAQPLDFFDANQFWPFANSLAFSDGLVGYAPAGLIGSGPHAALVRYDLLFLFAYALSFFAAYLLARELGLGRGAALVAGAAFAFAPFRLEQDGHMQVISSGGIALALALGVRAMRRRSAAAMIAAWLVALWQVSLGFSLGLPFAYLLGALALIWLGVWVHRRRPPLDRRLLVAAIAGGVVFAIGTGLLSIPYQDVADRFPEATRSPHTVAAYSGPLDVFLVAPAENLIWGGATAGIRDGLSNVPEKTLFPGLAIVCLAIAGVGWRGWPRGLRWGLAGAAVAISILALGFREQGGLLWPDRILYDLLPGWQGIRTPGRLITFSSLALALLAAAGTQRLLAAAVARDARRALAPALAAVLALLVIVEGRGLPFDPTGSQAQPAAPAAPASVAGVAAPQLHLPALLPEDNRRYLLWSTDGFPKLVNGRSSTTPQFTERLIAEMDGFPDRASVERLRQLGIPTVIVHLDRAAGTPQAGSSATPVAGLGVSRRRLGELEVYDVRSPSATGEPAAGRAATGRGALDRS
jgi:hypothetical protein